MKGVDLMIKTINEFADEMLKDSTTRSMWFAVLIFGIASTVLAWSMLPLTILEAALDPIFVIWQIYRTIKYYKNKQ